MSKWKSLGDVNDVMHRKRARRILGDLKKSVSWELDTEREGSTLRAPHEMGGRWKSQNRNNMYLSPYVEEPLNSKVIKSFVPELRSRKCFSCFGIPMFYVYMLWTFYVRFTYSCMGMLHLSYNSIQSRERNGFMPFLLRLHIALSVCVSERERECMCVCERERERERELPKNLFRTSLNAWFITIEHSFYVFILYLRGRLK